MSQRPQPVTSKFRSYYTNNIHPIYNESSKSSSAGSTSSLTSVLYHESFDDLSSECDNQTNEVGKFENNNIFFPIQPQPTKGMYCKRIIARQPQYPGERITLTKYDGNIYNKIKISKRKVIRSETTNVKGFNKSGVIKSSSQLSNRSKGIETPPKVISRKLASKSQSLTEHSVVKKSDPNPDDKSVNSYTTNDFSSVSDVDVSPEPKLSVEEKAINDGLCSTIEDTLSVSINDPSEPTIDPVVKRDQSNKLLTAWEAWYLKKEKQKRKKQELEMLKEKEKVEKEVEEKSKRSLVCQEKIQNWLIKKEEIHKKEVKTLKKRLENDKNEKEIKKEEMMKKSSEKYVQWKQEKEKREKHLEKEANEEKVKLEAEKMIKQAKAANAFNRWFEEHRDHQMQTPYSYGISDGKLTSYYDKTSNPPPSFFNPDPWKPIIEIKD